MHYRRSQLLVFAALLLYGCVQMSEKETDPSAGLNGGFEQSKNGLPVNWLIYSPKTVPEADFEVSLDQEFFKEGTQSLRFDVTRCLPTGGWYSPGLSNEFFEAGQFRGEATYNISLWIINQGSEFSVSAGGVTPNEGNMKTLLRSRSSIKEWKKFEFDIYVPAEHRLRFELNILSPGTLWIDQVEIRKTGPGSE